MRLNIDRDLVKQLVSGQLPNKSRHLDELTHEPSIWQCDTGQWLSCFDSCQLTILWMANVKDVDLPRHAWDTPPFLLIVSPTLPVQSVDAYVRSVSHVTTKRKEVDHIPWVWGSVPRALRARGSPAIICGIVYRQHNSPERFLEYFELTLELSLLGKMFSSWVTSIFVFWKVRYRNLVTTFYYLFRAVISFLPLTNLREFPATWLL